MNKHQITSLIVIILFFSWLGLSVIRTVFNFSKLVTEERQWYFLSYDEKRALQFGDTFYFLKFVENHTTYNSQILFFTDDLKTHYFGRYFLYPTKIIGEHEKHIWNPTADYYDYILIYPANHKELIKKAFADSNIKIYKKIETYHGKKGELGLLYKK